MSNLFDRFNSGNTQVEPDNSRSPFGNMFGSNGSKKTQDARKPEPAPTQEPSSGKLGRKPYERKTIQVTTRLYEDNKDWIMRYAEERGVHTGQIAYVLNMLIDKERGLQ